MNELKDVKQVVNPNEIMLVVDSMTGQDAVNVAKSFNEQIDITGVILTKLDGDTRGGAALSIRAMTGKPIKFIGLGEKMNDFQVFHPDRMASRILGMGDVLSLIEKAQQSIDQDEAKQLGERMLNKEFNFQDFLDVMQQAKKLGPISKLVEMIPGVDSKILKGVDLSQGEKDLKIKEAIIKSMTQKERLSPVIISSSSSRKKRIASGSGTTIQQVNRLLKDFDKTKKMMKQFNGIKNGKGFGKNLFGKMPF
jgi:signal recognition particle subunit SRP54